MKNKNFNLETEAQASQVQESTTVNQKFMDQNNKTTEVSASPRENAELTGPSAVAELENGNALLINRQELAMVELRKFLPCHDLSEILQEEPDNPYPEDYAFLLIAIGIYLTEADEFYAAFKCFCGALEYYVTCSTAWINIGMCFWQGKGVCQCYEWAVLCFWMTADDSDALLMLAHAYDEGKGVRKDQNMAQLIEEKEAARSRKVGKVSDQQAKYALAVSLDEGVGMKKNRRKAYKLFAELAEEGYEPAYDKAAHEYWGRYQDGEDRTKAKYFAGLAAAQGYVDSQYLFGLMSHSDGDSIIGSFFINLAAQQGHEGAIKYINR